MARPFVVLFLALVLAVPAHAQGLLTRTRLATDGGSPSAAPAAPPSSSRLAPVQSTWFHGLNDADPAGVLALAAVGIALVASPLWAPAALFEEHFYSNGSFPGHPYALPDVGYIESGFLYPSNDERDYFDPQHYKPWATRFSLEDGHDFGTLNRISGRFALDTKWRVGVTSDWDHYTESLPGGGTDETTIGTLNLTLRIAQTEWLQMHAGVGARGLFDQYRTRGGVNFQYGADLFPTDPVVVSSLIEMGNLNEAFVMRLRASVGIQLQHAEIFAGYDWLRIGPVDLHGPMVGLRLWF